MENLKKGDKIYIIGNGGQAPYGIGEIINIIPGGHIRRVQAALGQYYNEPIMRLNSTHGDKIALECDEHDDVIGYRTLDPY